MPHPTHQPRMDSFTRSYFETALWSTNDESDPGGGVPLDRNYSIDDFAPETRRQMIADAADFQERYADLLADSGLDNAKAGHYFWLSREGHGAGFFDEDLDELQEAARNYGEFPLYVDDDGMIHTPGEIDPELVREPPRFRGGAEARRYRVPPEPPRHFVAPREHDDSGFSTIDDAANAMANDMGLDYDEVRAALRANRQYLGRWEDLHGYEYDRVQRLVWGTVTGGQRWPWGALTRGPARRT